MIKIIPYESRWPIEFQSTADNIMQAIGSQVVGIHHIGSTSVPGLPAKDIIDIQITVVDLMVPISAALIDIGFESTEITEDHCPPGMSLPPDQLEKRYYR